MALTRWIRQMRRSAAVGRCHQIRPLVQAFLDAERDPLDAVRVADHLDACWRCGLDADSYRALKGALVGMRTTVDDVALRRLERFLDDLVVV